MAAAVGKDQKASREVQKSKIFLPKGNAGDAK